MDINFYEEACETSYHRVTLRDNVCELAYYVLAQW